MRVVLIPTNTGGRDLPRSGARHSNRTATCGRPSVTVNDWTTPGHHFPLPKRTIHTHTGVPTKSSTTSDGFINYFEKLSLGSIQSDQPENFDHNSNAAAKAWCCTSIPRGRSHLSRSKNSPCE